LSIENIVKEVRAEISRLQQVLVLLGETGHGVSVKKTAAVTATTGNPRRKMSAAGRKRIAAAQRARWAKIRAGKK
jgi:ABC-type dipeptide/oligopeptide/nickel transport system ATPase component